MPRHKHADVIHAWAEGEEVQSRVVGTKSWDDVTYPKWLDSQEYRIKPKTVKREGWVNVYRGNHSATVHQSKELAESCYGHGRIACIRIEWEEESND